MPVNPDFRDLFFELNAAEARFLIAGAHAVTFHSVPRYTKDIDIWIEPTRENADRTYSALSRFGAPVERVSVEDLCSPGVVFQIGVEPNRIDVLTSIAGLEFGEAWGRKISSAYGGVPISVLGLDDLIASKKAAGPVPRTCSTSTGWRNPEDSSSARRRWRDKHSHILEIPLRS